MKKFLIHLLLLLPFPLLIIGINYYQDPAYLFQDSRYEEGIASYLSDGYNVTNVQNCDERLVQKFFIEKIHECPSEVILGSSRIMQIGSKFAENGKLVNSGVSGASLEDYLALYYLYEKKGCPIKKITLGLDPWILNENNGQIRWKTLAQECSEFVKKISHNTDSIIPISTTSKYARYGELLSLSYFKTSLSYLFKSKNNVYKSVKSNMNDEFTKLKDGSIEYDKLTRSATPYEIQSRADIFTIADPVYSLGNYTEFSKKYQLWLTRFVEYLQGKGIKVEFFLSPFHPTVYKYFLNKKYYHIVFDTEKYYRSFATNHHIKVVGSFDPSKYNLDNNIFIDGLHISEKGIAIIYKKDTEKLFIKNRLY
jgi:hypothetical protein